MPNCEKYRELCSSSIDGQLSEIEEKELLEHLSECPACAEYLEDIRQMQNAWEDIKQPLPDDLHEKIMKNIVLETEKQTHRQKSAKSQFPVFTVISAVAACVMIALSGAVGDIISIVSNNENNETEGNQPTGQLVMEKTIEETKENIEEPSQPEQNEQTQPETQQTPETEYEQEQPQVEQHYEVLPRVVDEQPQTKQEQIPAVASNEQGKQDSEQTVMQSPAAFSVEGQQQLPRNAAENQSVKIPSYMQTSSFAFCCVAVGSGEVPVIENSNLVEKDDNIYYFKVTGVISDFDNTVAALKENGFETTMRTDLDVKIDTNASEGLLILVVNQ